MKVYSIRKTIFWLVLALILILPVSRHWRLMVFGERTTGTVHPVSLHRKLNFVGETELYYVNDISFIAGDSVYIMPAPTQYELEPGRKLTVFHRKKNPRDYFAFNLACLYFTPYSILLVILPIVWYAFYLSFNIYNREHSRR